MKGITCCAECAYYEMRTHKCQRGCTQEPDMGKDDDVRFFADCPLCESEPVKKGQWLYAGINGTVKCSVCQFTDFFARRDRVTLFGFCPGCGAKMEEGAE